MFTLRKLLAKLFFLSATPTTAKQTTPRQRTRAGNYLGMLQFRVLIKKIIFTFKKLKTSLKQRTMNVKSDCTSTANAKT